MMLEKTVANMSEIRSPEKLSTLTILKTNITSAEDAALFVQEGSTILFNLKWVNLD